MLAFLQAWGIEDHLAKRLRGARRVGFRPLALHHLLEL